MTASALPLPVALPTSRRPEVLLLGCRADNLTMAEAVDALTARLDARQSTRVAFVNADCLNIVVRRPAYRRALDTADLVFMDGAGIRLAGKLLGKPVRDNVNGTDLFPHLCAALAQRGARLFLLGAAPGIAERVAGWVAANHPGVNVVGCQHGYYPPEQAGDVLNLIRAARPDVLLVAFGAPRQDCWLVHNLAATGATLGIGVGGLFDFYSGAIPRAPRWMRSLGVEWVWRLIQEPGRLWRRYLIGNFTFMGRVLRARYAR
jgi:N-acetylglucosaminyldiphosphoundecaprenol N-acetyl-beta-D-mannosaminyltransferase